MSNLTPEVRVNKNGVPVVKHVNNDKRSGGSNPKRSIPAPGTNPRRTFAGTLRELAALGVDLRENTALKKNFSVKTLIKHDPEMLERIIEAIKGADQPETWFWHDALGRMELADVTKKGEEYARQHSLIRRPEYERALSNSRLPHLLHPKLTASNGSGRVASIARQAEHRLGIAPGDPRYAEVQAAIILADITYPDLSPRSIAETGCFETNRDDINFIAANMDMVTDMLPLLIERRMATRGFIESLRSIRSSSLIDGAL
jgi:hypothetical protein